VPPSPRSPSQPNAAAGIKPAEQSRIAELAQRLKADNARIADRIDRAVQQASRPANSPPQTAASASTGLRPSLDQAAAAAVAAALEPQGDEVSIRPMPHTKPACSLSRPKARGRRWPNLPCPKPLFRPSLNGP